MNEQRCAAINKDGSPCRAKVRPERPYCWQHDDELADRRAQWRSNGGKGRSNAARARAALPEDLRDVGDWLLQAMADVRAGTMEPAQGNTLANLARSFVLLHEAGAAESRLSRIEEAIAEEAVG